MRKEVKTSIDGLEVGMYVSRLDKPWLKTAYELQGVHIRSEADIERLRKCCNYVYVDTEIGSSPEPRFWVLREGPRSYQAPVEKPRRSPASGAAHSGQPRNEYTALRKHSYENTTRVDAEFGAANQAYEELNQDFQRMLTSIQQDKGLDVDALNNSISRVVDSIIRNPEAMTLVVKLRQLDDYAYTRALGTSVWCATFGRHLGLEKGEIEKLTLGGVLLDAGKSQLPVSLLKKREPLSVSEMEQIRSHVDLGVRMLSSTRELSLEDKLPVDVMQMIATHHERADGSGYPQGLKNAEIPVYGRIAGIVDSFDAMTSERPYAYGPAKSPHEAIAELYELRGKTFQPELVEQFIQTVGLYPTGSLVELSSGEVGAVIAINGLRRLRPSIMLLLDDNKEPLKQFRFIDLSRSDENVTVVRGLPRGSFGIDMKAVFL